MLAWKVLLDQVEENLPILVDKLAGGLNHMIFNFLFFGR